MTRALLCCLLLASCGSVTTAADVDGGRGRPLDGNTGELVDQVDASLEHGNTVPPADALEAAAEGPPLMLIMCTSQTAIVHVDQCPNSCDKAICTTGDHVQHYVGCDRHSSGDPSSSYYCPPLGTVGGGVTIVPTVTCVAACP